MYYYYIKEILWAWSLILGTNLASEPLECRIQYKHFCILKSLFVAFQVIQCGRVGHKFGKPVCVEIVCRLSELLQNRPVQISVTGWLYTPTFFEHSTSDIEVRFQCPSRAGHLRALLVARFVPSPRLNCRQMSVGLGIGEKIKWPALHIKGKIHQHIIFNISMER